VRDLGILANPDDPFGPRGPTPQSFCYRIETRARDLNAFGQVLDRVPAATTPGLAACANRSGELFYDIVNATLKPINSTSVLFGSPIAARPIFVDVEGGRITGGVNPATLAGRPAQLLVFHHQNAPFPQAEIITVAQPPATGFASGRGRAYLPLASQ
jgi:hypothetical protein